MSLEKQIRKALWQRRSNGSPHPAGIALKPKIHKLLLKEIEPKLTVALDEGAVKVDEFLGLRFVENDFVHADRALFLSANGEVLGVVNFGEEES